jgi:glycosyltransferase involved in cell wall biosynthesis
MKIAIFSFYSGEVDRGVEVWVSELSHELKKLNYDITVYMNGKQKSEDFDYISSGIKINWEKNKSKFFRRFFLDYSSLLIAWSMIKFARRFLKEEYDVVIPTNGGWQVALVRIMTWIKGEKMVVVGHAGIGWDERNNLWAFPDLFIAISQRAQDWANHAMPIVKTRVIENGINLEKFTPDGEKAEIKLDRPIYLGVGAFIQNKRQELLIDAVSKLEKGSLLLIGEGPRKEMLEKQGKEKLGDRFKLINVDHKIIEKYYRACDVFSLPVWEREAWGLVFLEAMACGKPVVTTNDEIRKYIIDDAGILIDPTDTDVYAESLRYAVKMKWYDKPRKQAEKFGWDIVAKQYDKVFCELIK